MDHLDGKMPHLENSPLIPELYLVSSIFAIVLVPSLCQNMYVLSSHLILAREAIAVLLD